MGELAAAPPLTEGEKPISQNQSKLAVIRNVRYLSFRQRSKSRCHLPFSSRVLLAARDQPGRILRMPVRRCRNSALPSLRFISGILTVGIVFSVLRTEKTKFTAHVAEFDLTDGSVKPFG